MFATGDKEGLIKIWNLKKEIVREIKFTEPITAVCFLNNVGDLLVGHGCRLSRVYARDYAPGNGFLQLYLKYKQVEHGYDSNYTTLEEMTELPDFEKVNR